MMPVRLLVFLLVALAASGCAMTPPVPSERKTHAATLASAAGMEERILETAHFDLYSLARFSAPADELTVYIEGDGLAWMRRNERSTDPTPVKAVALDLAIRDRTSAVAYLARPCQFVGGAMARNCTDNLWTGARYSEQVVQSMSEALDMLKKRSGATRLGLVGFSGGGAIAALVAARRSDVVWFKTVASPLDTAAFTAHHKAPPLTESLNPADNAHTLSRLPQIHYVGADDKIVPQGINEAFLAHMKRPVCASLVVLPAVSHTDGWGEAWQQVGTDEPACP